MRHDFNDDGVCRNCGYDGAADYAELTNLRHEIGDDEYAARKASAEFDFHYRCPMDSRRVIAQNYPEHSSHTPYEDFSDV